MALGSSRVLLRPADRPTFHIWAGHRYFSLMAKMKALLKRVHRDTDGEFVKVHGYKQVTIPSRSYLSTLQ